MTKPEVSICMPTYGRVEILKNTLESIFFQGVENEKFEVCISDNSPTSETEEMLQMYFNDKENLIYKKSTCEGYFNSIEALKLGKGKFLKLHNNYTNFEKGCFSKFISFVAEYEEENVTLFFTSGCIKQKEEVFLYDSFDSFMNSISYFSTWSSSFGIMNKDFQRLLSQNIELDKMFPHTSLLFALESNRKFVVNNFIYFDNQDVGKKGGYNIPQVFGTRYLGMCNNLLVDKKISELTFRTIKEGILSFIADWYLNVKIFPKKYTFSYDKWEKTVFELYGRKGISYIKKYYLKNVKKRLLKKIAKKILSIFYFIKKI